MPTPTPTPTPTSPSGLVRLMAVGDVNLGWLVGDRIVAHGPDVPFAKVVSLFARGDVVLANLECTLSPRGEPWPGKEEHFAAPPRALDSLSIAGITAITVANNHSLDYGREGLVDTLRALDRAGIGHAGGGTDYDAAHAPLILERNGLRIAVLAYVVPFSSKMGFNTRAWAAGSDVPGLSVGEPEMVRAEVAATRRLADVVIVVVHSGGEFRRVPKHNQVVMAQAALDGGADLVIGHGPHNLQGVMRTGHTFVAYSIGNFVFDEYTGRQNDSAILDVTLSAEGVESVNWIPIEIEDGLPRPAVGGEVDRIQAQLEQGPTPRE